MQIESDRHFADDLLEKYSIGHLPEDQIPALEEHLFVCSDCQVRLSSIDEYVHVTKAAAAAELERGRAARKKPAFATLLGRFWPIPKPVWALGLAVASLAVVLGVMSSVQVQQRDQTELALSASRGDPSLMPHASSHDDILLKVDTASIAAAPVYELHLVNANGGEVWKGKFSPQANHQIVAKVPALSPGHYWVRKYLSIFRNLRRDSPAHYWVRIYRATDLENALQEYGVVID